MAFTSAVNALQVVVAYVLPSVLPVVATTAVWVTVVALLSVSTSMASLFKILNMFWWAIYPSWPSMFRRDIPIKRCVYTS